MKTILLTGHTGFLGSEIKSYYESNGFKVLTIGRNLNCDIKIDLASPEQIKNIQIDTSIAKIIHCAAVNETRILEDITHTYNVNVVSTRTLLELAKKLQVEEFVFISTFHVYGKGYGEINEKTQLRPLNDYGLTHMLSEDIVRNFCSWSKINFKIIRPTNIYGVPQNLSEFNRWSLVPFQFLRNAYTHSEIVIQSSGLQQRNFVSVDDVIKSFELDFQGELNVFGNDTLTIKEFAEKIAHEISHIDSKKVIIKILGQGTVDPALLHISNSTDVYQPSGKLTDFIKEFYLKIKSGNK